MTTTADSAITGTTVNEQITDSITQTTVQTLASVPSSAMGNLFLATGQALSNAAHNATTGQQHSNITSQTSTVQSVNSLTSIGTAVIGRSSEELLEK